MKIKRLLATLLALILAFSCFAVVPFTASAADAVVEETTTVGTKDAIFIGKTGSNQMSNIFVPLSARNTKLDGSGEALTGDTHFKVTFNAKMLSGTKPILGFVRNNYGSQSPSDGTYPEMHYVNNGSGTKTGSFYDPLYTKYDAQTGKFEAVFGATVSDNYDKTPGKGDKGSRWGYLTIGNAEHNGNWHSEYDYDVSFIMSDIEIKVYDASTKTTKGDNIAPSFSKNDVDFDGTYFVRKVGDDAWDNFFYAGANKWHIDTCGENIKRIQVPADYLTANYNAANFVKTAETDYTREYYTNANYNGMYFAALESSNNAGFEVVTDLNKKVIIIDANHEGEADVRDVDGYKPTSNRKANIFVPLNLAQYNINVSQTPETQFIVKVTFKAKILEGEGYPVLGRVVANQGKSGGNGTGTGSEALGKMAKNINLSGYYDAGSHESYYDLNGNLLSYSYNPETEEFVGYMRMKSGDSSYVSVWGTNEVLTIGNAENVWQDMTYDTTEFNSSFAISDVKVDAYKAESYNGGYKMVSLAGEDIAPDFYGENLDTTSTWQFKFDNGSSHATDLLRASQKTWSVDGAVGMVHQYNLTECFDKHTLTHHAATDTTREYYACSCGKNYADIAATEEIDDISAKKQMIVISAAGEKTAHVAIPLDLRGFTGDTWGYFEFKAKIKGLGADALPNVNLYLARREGQVGGATSTSDASVIDGSTSYDAATSTFTFRFKMWRPNIRKDYKDYFYTSPTNGANLLLALSNMTPVGNGGKDNDYYTTYAIAEPELYRVTSADLDAPRYDGENLINDITDKTVDFESQYLLSDYTSNYYSNTYSSPMTAKVNNWVRYGSGVSKIGVYDIPEGFFEGEGADANMLAIYGSGNQHAINYETFLEPGATYLFDIDYKTFGGVKALINPQIAGTGSYATVANATDTGSHYSVEFTMPSNARVSYDGNFKLYLGQKWPAKRNGSVYFANASLRKIEGAGPGENILLNGDFNYGNGEVIAEENYSEALPFWNKDDILNYAQAQTMDIPANFFDGDAVTTVDNVAIKMKGGNWNELQFKVQLEPSTTYRLTYNYRNRGDVVTVGARGTGSVVFNNISDNTDGKYLQTYELVTGADKVAGDTAEPNTRIYFALGTNSYDKEFYISNVALYKVVDGETVGYNLVGHLNPIFDSSVYAVVENGEVALALGGDDSASLKRFLAQGWLAASQEAKVDFTKYASLIKVDDDFFTYVAPATRLVNLRRILLGYEAADVTDWYQDVNNDGAVNVKDLVRTKKNAARAAGTAEGGAEASADAMYDKIMNAPNTEIKEGSVVYYVSNAGKDTNAGTSPEAPLATITKANQKASSGDTVLLNRGNTWRVVANSENGYTAKSGVTYGAYGEGEKPLILGSAKDYTKASWTNVSGNIWKTQVSSDAHDGNRIGNIYFFQNANDEEPTVIGRVVRNGQRFASYNDLIEEGDVYSDISDGWFGNDKGTVYVYCVGNPATKYGRIEVAEKREVFILESGVTFDNIAIKYAGGHAVNASNVKNVTVTNCEIGYVGGAPLNAEVYGNGIQFGLGGENITVKNNYVYQCLDAGITFQSWGVSGTNDDTEFENVTFADNLLTNNYYNIEFFTTGTSDYKIGANNAGNGKFTDIYITGNIMRFAGECWSATQRMDSADGTGNFRSANICVTQDAYYINTSNLNIADNIFDCTTSSHVYWTWDDVTADVDKTAHVGLNVSGNTFYQKAGATDNRVMMFGNTSSYSYASSQYGLEQAVARFDSNPGTVQWLDTIN